MGTLVLLPLPKRVNEAQERSDARQMLAGCVHRLQQPLTDEVTFEIVGWMTEAARAIMAANKATRK